MNPSQDLVGKEKQRKSVRGKSEEGGEGKRGKLEVLTGASQVTPVHSVSQ